MFYLYLTQMVPSQKRLCDELAEIEGSQFKVDRWERTREPDGSSGGGGVTCIIQDGRVFEKAGESPNI